VALLHDTIEDTSVTPEYLLEQGFSQDIVDAILSVTKREGESYEDFVKRAAQNPIGRVVKLHDLEDNLDVLRLSEVKSEDAQRLTKYLKAYHFLLGLMK
jgi:(p)ppGpp synthase/HD superfamily hydrolase